MKFVKNFTTEEAIEKIENLEGLGALVKTQADLEKIQKMILRDPSDFKRRSNSN